MAAETPKVVCIVGVAGFIGSHLLEKIIRERDWHVLGVDMVAPNKIQQLLGAEKKWASRFEFHQMNITHKDSTQALKGLIVKCDVVVNLAAICNPSEYIKQPVNTINSNFTDAQARAIAIALCSHHCHGHCHTAAVAAVSDGLTRVEDTIPAASMLSLPLPSLATSPPRRPLSPDHRLPRPPLSQDCINFCVEFDKHLIHFSTCEVYGRTLASYGLPKDDPKNVILDEETTPMIMGPVSAQRWCYACAKQVTRCTPPWARPCIPSYALVCPRMPLRSLACMRLYAFACVCMRLHVIAFARERWTAN